LLVLQQQRQQQVCHLVLVRWLVECSSLQAYSSSSSWRSVVWVERQGQLAAYGVVILLLEA
jgi:regulator of sirC expression with transglutaminase-like and TPR domain